MNHWLFVAGAYAFALIGTVGLAWMSWSAMRRAEGAAADLRQEPDAGSSKDPS